MNFVPKKPVDIALSEALAAVTQPAWVVDTSRGLVVRSNGRCGAVWGVPVMTPALDSAIPALRALRARLAGPRASHAIALAASASEILSFNTASGERAIPCTVRLLDETAGRGMMLIVAEADSAGAASHDRSGAMRPDLAQAGAGAEAARSALSAWHHVLGRTPIHTGSTGGMPLSDADTLREIARRIRQGSTGPSNANDAPDEHDELSQNAPGRGPPAPGGSPPFDWPEHLAHEIRTPLAAIVSLAEVITQERLGAWPNERYRGYIGDILDSARHGLDVVDGILRGLPDPQGSLPLVVDMDLNAEVEALCTSLRPLAEKSSAQLAAALVGSLPRVVADRRNVRQMLLNLITNSLKHGGGPVRIKVTTGYELSGEVWVEVEDDGLGLAAAAKGAGPKAARGAAGQRSTGLGLPLTRSLAAANGARLDISSGPGGGVRARIVFGRDRVSPPAE